MNVILSAFGSFSKHCQTVWKGFGKSSSDSTNLDKGWDAAGDVGGNCSNVALSTFYGTPTNATPEDDYSDCEVTSTHLSTYWSYESKQRSVAFCRGYRRSTSDKLRAGRRRSTLWKNRNRPLSSSPSLLKSASLESPSDLSEREVYVQCVHLNNKTSTPPSLLNKTQGRLSSSPLTEKLDFVSSSSETYCSEREVRITKNSQCPTSPSLVKLTHSLSPSPSTVMLLDSSLESDRSEREVDFELPTNSNFEKMNDTCGDCNALLEEEVVVIKSVKRCTRFYWSSEEDELLEWGRDVPLIGDTSAEKRRCVPWDEDEKLRAGCFVYVKKLSEMEINALQAVRHTEDGSSEGGGKRVYNLRKRNVGNNAAGKQIDTRYRRMLSQLEEK